MATRKPRDSEPRDAQPAISPAADDWIRQFIKHFELQFLDSSSELQPDASNSESQLATARGILATFVESGLESESVLELFGQVAVERRSAEVAWSDALNQRRFVLIDRKIQGSMTAAERIELTGLTRIMRDQIDSESNLPMAGARVLHRKLLQLDSMGDSD